MPIKHIFARFNDSMVLGGKVGMVVTPGPEIGTCEGTGEELSYRPDCLYEVLGVAKDLNAARAAGWFDRPVEMTPDPIPEPQVVVKEEDTEGKADFPKPARRDELCPECGGPRRGRGYAHKDGCSKDSRRMQQQNRSNETCPECGGMKRGRGFSHKPGCSKSCKVS